MPDDKPFNATDLGDDAIGLLDALGVAEAHIARISAGGVFAQYAAIRHPLRVVSLICMISTSGDVRSEHGLTGRGDARTGRYEYRPPRPRQTGSLCQADNERLYESQLGRFRRAANQIAGAAVMGIGMALFEETHYDERTMAPLNRNLADYVMSTNADTPTIDVTFLDHPDLL